MYKEKIYACWRNTGSCETYNENIELYILKKRFTSFNKRDNVVKETTLIGEKV